jgi:hypothetical protein
MDERAWYRLGAASGIATVAIHLIGFAIHGYPKMGASGSELQSWARAASVTQFAIGRYVEAFGILLFVVFAAWVYTLLRRSDRARWLALASFGSALVWTAVLTPINEIWFGVLKAGKAGVDPQLLVVIRDLGQDIFNISYLALGFFLLTTGTAAIVSKAIPPLLGWSAAVLGVALFVPALTMPAAILFFLWILVLCGLAITRPYAEEAR